MTEQTFKTWDGVELFYRAWLPAQPTDRALLLFHRGHEHSGRWQETVEALGLEDVAVFAWDARGHGHSPGERGSAENIGVVIRDVEAFVRHVSERHRMPVENMVVLAHSVGAVTAAAWVHDFAPPIRGLVLAAPAFRVKLYVPLAVPLLRLKQKLLGHGHVKSYVKAKMLTHDPAQAARYQADPRIFRQIAVNILLDLHDTSTRLLADAGAITTPTLLLVAGSDWVVKSSAQRTFFSRLSSPLKRLEVLPGFYHAIFHEQGRDIVAEKVREFVRECFERPPERVSLMEADQRGFTKEEYDRLLRRPQDRRERLLPLPVRNERGEGWGEGHPTVDAHAGHTKNDPPLPIPLLPRGEEREKSSALSSVVQAAVSSVCRPSGLFFAAARVGMRTVGRLSRGIRLGWESGFDSGRTLDYVYENKAQGAGLVGRIIDRAYLDSIGWRGIRRRKQNLQRVLREAIERVERENQPVRLLDIASGPGRYVLETVRDLAQPPSSVLLRDCKPENVEAARRLAGEYGLKNITAAQGDAFDRASLAALAPKPTIAIVSGLYELFPANEPVLNSLRGLADAIDPGGYLIYTNQPWHPQVEFIARVLTNREGQPWIMRRRTQAEMDELVRAAGFEKLRQEIDQWGIFSVSLARRK